MLRIEKNRWNLDIGMSAATNAFVEESLASEQSSTTSISVSSRNEKAGSSIIIYVWAADIRFDSMNVVSTKSMRAEEYLHVVVNEMEI